MMIMMPNASAAYVSHLTYVSMSLDPHMQMDISWIFFLHALVMHILSLISGLVHQRSLLTMGLCIANFLCQSHFVYRKYSDINIGKFEEDIQNSVLLSSSGSTAVSSRSSLAFLVQTYNKVLHELLDKHAPQKKCTITIKPNAPWYNSETLQAKRLTRKAERRWRKSKLEVDKQSYIEISETMSKLIVKTQEDYYNSAVINCGNDQRALFKVVNKVLHQNKENPLPTRNSFDELANEFADFFIDKIKNIRSELNVVRNAVPFSDSEDYVFSGDELNSFRPAVEEEVAKLIRKSPDKSCSLDAIPTHLVKKCMNTLVPLITKIINLSLSVSEMPEDYKDAILIPLIKKAILDCEILKKFRPVSNLTFISKLIEKVVAIRLNEHMQLNKLHECFQSAYKQLHSMETALLRVQSDILRALDDHGAVLLVLLDLSAAFDTVDHSILLKYLNTHMGIRGEALAWLESYLTGRTQRVYVNGVFSSSRSIECGVPQGSVLGPILFTIYLGPLGDIIRKHGLPFHLYADDSQLYITFKPITSENLVVFKCRLEACISEIRAWMVKHMLKLNDDKTEFMLIMSKYHKGIDVPDLIVGKSEVKATSVARNLGAMFDKHMWMDKHVNVICRESFFHLRNLSKVRHSLSEDSLVSAVHAFISSKLDYCNSLLYGVPASMIEQLQRIQNTAAKIVVGAYMYDHVTPILKKLHWLPVFKRVEYKIILLTFKGLNGLAPVYIREMLTLYEPSRSLRSSGKNLLQVPKSNQIFYGNRSFYVAGPKLWNSLPQEMRLVMKLDSFKRQLKTHLFKLAYD